MPTYAQQKARVDGYGNDMLDVLLILISDGDSHPDVAVTSGADDEVVRCYVESTDVDDWWGPTVIVTTIEQDSTVQVHASRVAPCTHIDYTPCDVCGGNAVIVPPLYIPARCGKTECREA